MIARVGALTTVLALASGCASSSQPSSVDSNVALGQARNFTGFPLYWAGTKVGDLPFTGVSSFSEHFGEAYNFDYGTCVVSDGAETCADPLSIQVTNLCNRLPKDLGVHLSQIRLRGARTSDAEAGADNGASLSIYVKGATITIYGSHTLVLAAAQALRGANQLAAAAPGQPLPAASVREIAGIGC
jgi:hypothetical protein